MYEYRAMITKVYDGDTVTADIDLGFGVILRKQSLRLLGINAPELTGGAPEQNAAGKVARIALMSELLGMEVRLVTRKDHREKYGRWLAEIFLGDLSVNQWMVDGGYAVPYMENT